MSRLTGLLVPLALFAFVPLTAQADDIATLRNIPDAPAILDACTWEYEPYATKLDADFHASGSALVAVQIRFQFVDAFGAPESTQDVTAAGDFSPGVKIQKSGDYGGWEIGKLRWPGPVQGSHLVCTILKTKDAAGTVWSNPNAK